MRNTNRDVPEIKDFRPFIICTPENYEETKAFYSDLGFEKLWDDESSACEFSTGFASQRFLVTLHYNIEPPKNAMLHFWVSSAADWYEYVNKIVQENKHANVTVTPPVLTDWGWLITYVADPAGVKLHFGEPQTNSNKEFFDETD